VSDAAARSRAAILVAALLSACAQTPAPPDEVAPAPRVVRPDGTREEAVRRHRDLAREARAAGDLATAVDHLHVVVLLAPDDDAAKRDIEALREQIRRGVREGLETGRNAMRAGDGARASAAFLHVLALDPKNAEASRSLRELDRQNMARSQSSRAARVNVQDMFAEARAAKSAGAPPSAPAGSAASPSPAAAAAASAAAASDAIELDQRLEMFRAGDTTGALRELKAWVDAHPKDRASRQKVAAAVAERAKEFEGKQQREAALGLYEQALVLRAEPQPEWSAKVAALKKQVSADYYGSGMKLMRTDLNGAVKAFEASVKLDPQNANAQRGLREATAARDKLSRMPAK
jgi:tetratricopeptide (TPR) repeat protein